VWTARIRDSYRSSPRRSFFIGDDTVADAICDRLVRNAHRLSLKGESMRKRRGLRAAVAQGADA
jgi:DNA replication protein DnaC